MRFSDLPIIRDIDWYFRCKKLARISREREARLRLQSSPFYLLCQHVRQQNERALRPVVRTHYCSKV